MAVNEPTINVDKFLGIRNREQSRRMQVGSLETAVNIDIDDFGGIILREGYFKEMTFSNITASFSTQDETRLFIISGGELILINKIGESNIIEIGMPNDYIYWLEVADFIFLSSGHIINKDNTVSKWRIPNPAVPNDIIGSGDLKSGRYQIVIAFVDSTGREGPASDNLVVIVDDGSSITLNVSQLPDYSTRVYITDFNGSVHYLYGEFSVNTVTISNITSKLTYPINKEQLMSYPVPDNSDVLAFYEGKIWASSLDNGNSTIRFSKPYWWNLFDLQNDYIVVPGKVNMMVGLSTGLLIGTDDEIYVYTTQDALVRLSEYGVPKGKSYSVDDTGLAYIHTNQGMCTALPFNNLTEEKVSLPPGDVCFADFVEQNGYKKLLILTDLNGNSDNKLTQ